MKLLLDTHIWLWTALEPDRLTRRVAREITDPENELWLSAVSIWELTVLQRKGRFNVPEKLTAWVQKSMRELELFEASLTVEVALALSSMAFSHADPADQFLVATAKVFGLTLVTSDRNLLRTKEISVMEN